MEATKLEEAEDRIFDSLVKAPEIRDLTQGSVDFAREDYSHLGDLSSALAVSVGESRILWVRATADVNEDDAEGSAQVFAESGVFSAVFDSLKGSSVPLSVEVAFTPWRSLTGISISPRTNRFIERTGFHLGATLSFGYDKYSFHDGSATTHPSDLLGFLEFAKARFAEQG